MAGYWAKMGTLADLPTWSTAAPEHISGPGLVTARITARCTPPEVTQATSTGIGRYVPHSARAGTRSSKPPIFFRVDVDAMSISGRALRRWDIQPDRRSQP